MNVNRSGETLTFSFDRREWDISDGDAVRAFIAELKARIPGDQRSYDSSRNAWTVKSDFAPILEELKEKHFVDHRQTTLF